MLTKAERAMARSHDRGDLSQPGASEPPDPPCLTPAAFPSRQLWDFRSPFTNRSGSNVTHRSSRYRLRIKRSSYRLHQPPAPLGVHRNSRSICPFKTGQTKLIQLNKLDTFWAQLSRALSLRKAKYFDSQHASTEIPDRYILYLLIYLYKGTRSV